MIAQDNPLRGGTQLYDTETDLYCYQFRYYSPATGRWLSRDPLGEAGGRNLYAFCGNNPLNSVDLLGLCGSGTGSGESMEEREFEVTFEYTTAYNRSRIYKAMGMNPFAWGKSMLERMDEFSRVREQKAGKNDNSNGPPRRNSGGTVTAGPIQLLDENGNVIYTYPDSESSDSISDGEPKDHGIGIAVWFKNREDRIGHAFNVFIPPSGVVMARGFYGEALFSYPGHVRDDIKKYNAIINGMAIGWIEYCNVTRTQYCAATKKLSEYISAGKRYDLHIFTCSDFAAQIFKVGTGITAYIGDGTPRNVWRTMALRMAGTKYVPKENQFKSETIDWDITEILQILF